ncbi:MAG: TetR family transcriptional regulator, partial [Cyanobacteria bacterium P01_E01_bin.45]
LSQGIQETTTKQIAELAEVNEVTLFRQFGSKHGLLLGLLDDTAVFAQLREILGNHQSPSPTVAQAAQTYAIDLLELLDRGAELLRSLVGESGQFSEDTCQALGRTLTRINRITTQYLAATLPQHSALDAATVQSLARLLNCIVLGYTVLEFTSDAHNLWPTRDEFLADVEGFFTRETAAALPTLKETENGASVAIADLPSNLVKDILQRAKKRGSQDYALAYVVLSTGLSAAEIAALERWHYINNPPQHLLQVTQGVVRQVPMNRWVMGQKYGSDARNPLTQWVNSRKDDWQALFFVGEGTPASEDDIQTRWQAIVEGLLTPQGTAPTLQQARQTWYVDMLGRGVSVDDLELLTDLTAEELQPYAKRAAEKAALERAMSLDTKPES